MPGETSSFIRPGSAAFAGDQLSEDDFDALAAGTETAAVIQRLRAAERGRRRLLLRALLDAARAHPEAAGPLAPLDAAWDLLVRAEERRADLTSELMDHPPVGAWAARTLRRIRGRVYDDVPLWVDVGYLHALAATAALATGLDFALDVPVRHGAVVLPTLGSVDLRHRDAWETATVSRYGILASVGNTRGRVILPPAAGVVSPGWHPTKRLRVNAGDRTLALILEDADPFRLVLRPARPARLSAATTARWQRKVEDGWWLLVRHHRARAEGLAAGMSVLVPLPAAQRFRPRGASSGDAFGSADLSEPDDGTWLAEALIHEFQHTKLGALMQLVDLWQDECPEVFYAPWRDDPRPLHGQLHGIFAFFGVAEFWRRQRQVRLGAEAAFAEFEFALGRRQVWDGLHEIRARPELTDPGRRFLDGVALRVRGWRSEPVAQRSAYFADLAVRGHRAGWRARHLRPSEERVAELARRWLAHPPAAGAGPPGAVRPGAVRPDRATATMAGAGSVPPGVLRSDDVPLDARTALIRLWLADRNAFRAVQRSDSPAETIAGAITADLALVAGDHTAARAGYLGALAANPDSPNAWAGLGLVLASDGHEPAGWALLERPHLVRAVFTAIRAADGPAPDPVALASWLGRLGDPA